MALFPSPFLLTQDKATSLVQLKIKTNKEAITHWEENFEKIENTEFRIKAKIQMVLKPCEEKRWKPKGMKNGDVRGRKKW